MSTADADPQNFGLKDKVEAATDYVRREICVRSSSSLTAKS
jgi:hypothetical protein